jgi:hypothetical protein
MFLGSSGTWGVEPSFGTFSHFQYRCPSFHPTLQIGGLGNSCTGGPTLGCGSG